MKHIAILGSTGSIGQSALKVVRHLGPDQARVVALSAKSSIDLLEKQALEFLPEIIGVYDETKARELQLRLPHIPVLGGMEGVEAVASYAKADFVLSAMTGTVGLVPTIAAIKSGKDVGLANKETLVSAGELVMSLARQHGIRVIPVDSEHSAIYQCLHGEDPAFIRRIILTASGGPFRTLSDQELDNVTLDTALRHPTWSMGPKVTIDSSTLMNKGLEVIEVHWLFNMPMDKIEVVIHPQSVIHSMVEFTDGSIIAQMSQPTMLLPIQYAITCPERLPGLLPPFDFTKNSTLQFFPPDTSRFRCLELAYQAGVSGGSLPCYMNAANEVLVHRFLERQISWKSIAVKLEALMQSHKQGTIASLDDILQVDAEARKAAWKA
jgi:1-deoxy-D-xylulose-5-phosphate reductoisomerase